MTNDLFPISLTDESYRYGSYCRGDLRGDILYGVISFCGMDLLMAPDGMVFAQDAWESRCRPFLPPASCREYLARLQEDLRAVATDETPFESLYETALSLRRQVFGPELDNLSLRQAQSPPPGWDRVDYAQPAFLDRWVREKRTVLLLLQDVRYVSFLRADLAMLRGRGLRVYVAVSDTARGSFPSESLLRSLFPGESFSFLHCEGPLSQAWSEDESLARDAAQGDVFLLYYGEKGLTDCCRLSVPAYVRCVPESLTGKALAGAFTGRGLCGIAVPAHFDILPLVPLRRRTLASFRQFAFLCDQVEEGDPAGEDIYRLSARELYSRWPEAFFSVYEERNLGFPRGIVWPQTRPVESSTQLVPSAWYADFCDRRDAALAALLDSLPGVRALGGWFALESWARGPVPWTAEGEAWGILVHGFRLDRPVSARVILSVGEPVSPRHLAEQIGPDAVCITLNYLFFLTSRLAGRYNRLRDQRPREQMRLPCGHIDYLLQQRDDHRVETFPLYRKACMALKEDGTFAFFHFRLGGGSCQVGGTILRWKAEDVDPAIPGEIAVWTPLLSASDAGADRATYIRPVGEGRVNLVLIGDRVVCAREGDVLLPPIGVVLSLQREKGLAFLRQAGFGPLDDRGYVPLDAPAQATVRLDPPSGFSPEEWARVRWAYGGGLTLIHQGVSCFDSEESSRQHLAREGWASPLSAQTQESDIAAIVRHPRTAIGLTRDGRLFALVFSGRSSFSAGATYPEMCAITKQLVPDVWELMNVDGGGSSVLGITVDGRFIEYSWPSSSPSTPAGLVRPIHSLFQVDLDDT